MTDFEKLIQLLKHGYYGDLIMVFFELFAIITGLLLVRKDKTGVFFLGYLIFDFSVLLCYYYITLSTSFNTEEILFYIILTNTLISFVELLTYYHFFFNIIRNKSTIKLMKFFLIIFIGIVVIFITIEFSFLTQRYSYVSDLIAVIEFLFLLLLCFVYFYELLKNDPVINLYQRPSFWIVTGIFFYSVISVPYYLTDRFIASNHYKYRDLLQLSFFNIPFTINFIFLTKAFLCKKMLTI